MECLKLTRLLNNTNYNVKFQNEINFIAHMFAKLTVTTILKIRCFGYLCFNSVLISPVLCINRVSLRLLSVYVMSVCMCVCVGVCVREREISFHQYLMFKANSCNK